MNKYNLFYDKNPYSYIDGYKYYIYTDNKGNWIK